MVVPLRRPTADTGKLVYAAAMGMRRMYQPGYRMAKAGVMLLDLVPGSVLQGELDLDDEDHRDRSRLMVALDALNGRYGKSTVHSASTGGSNKVKDWGMKQERRTPQYTTKWADDGVGGFDEFHGFSPGSKGWMNIQLFEDNRM